VISLIFIINENNISMARNARNDFHDSEFNINFHEKVRTFSCITLTINDFDDFYESTLYTIFLMFWRYLGVD